MSRIFISYRRRDSEGYVGRLYDHLTKHFAHDDIFMDVTNMRPGEDFVQVLEESVQKCDVMLAVIGAEWLTIKNEDQQRRLDDPHDFVRIEIASALKQNKYVIPVLVQDAKMPRPSELPEDLVALARRQAHLLTHSHFGLDVGTLVGAIRAAMVMQAETAPPEIIEQKSEALKALRDELISFKSSPLYDYRVQNHYYPVLGEGNPDANILFIGESPGRVEAEQGRPFCGPSGEVLDEMLDEIGLRREDVYMTNVLLDRTPENRDPTPLEIEQYTPFADRLLDIVQPAVIVTLGRFAMYYILKKFNSPDKRGKISDLHGKLIRATAPYGDIHIIPMYHPAVVLYTAKKREVLRQDFEKLRIFV